MSIERNRARVLAGARKLLEQPSGTEGFSVDAVARHAGVARATVYYQFKSKTGLLEALYDDLAKRASLPERIKEAFRQTTLTQALDALVRAYVHFWSRDRAVIRRLHAFADIDPDFARSDRSRWRRDAIRALLKQHAANAPTRPRSLATAVDVIHTLTSFETYDSLARGAQGQRDVVTLLHSLVMAHIRSMRADTPMDGI